MASLEVFPEQLIVVQGKLFVPYMNADIFLPVSCPNELLFDAAL
jgi:hypothetical protein